MKLRVIFLVLSLLAFLSAASGGYFYYRSLRESAFREAERQAVNRVAVVQNNLDTFLSENVRPARTLAGMDALVRRLAVPGAAAVRAAAEEVLDHFNHSLGADVCYLMDRRGVTIASSNRLAEDSFVGKDFSFRPYFREAVRGRPATYLALGTTSGRRGVYCSHPVCAEEGGLPLGVVVIKASLEQIEKKLGTGGADIVLVTDPHGLVFITSRPDWLYHLLWERAAGDLEDLTRSRQFGSGPWPRVGLRHRGEHATVDREGIVYQFHRREIDSYPGWYVVHLRSLAEITRVVSDPLARITAPTVFSLCILIGLSVFFLYRKASLEIVQRRQAEEALRASEERYRSIYHRTPAMLHSINPEGRIVSVSDHWLEVLGYERDEVVGRPLTDFLSPESRVYAEREVLPRFFRTGFCKDIPYQLRRRGGAPMDVLLSAIGDRDAEGRIVRSLAVSIDISARKRAEEALTRAKEELDYYSRELERQVKMRTREINSILRFTPAVVYMKDLAGRYQLVNSRYEELFGVKNEDIRGRTDDEFLPREVADQLREHDLQVLAQGAPRQVVERIGRPDGPHIFLAVKFPIYDDAGAPSGVCSIATDATALKRAQDRLRRLSGGIMASQEHERAAIARGLHDELGQVLTALRIDAIWLEERLRSVDPAAAERALAMSRLIDHTIDEVRSIAMRLRPGILDDLGLVDALEWLATDFERRTGIACTFIHGDMPTIGGPAATAAYRIAQEALTNVMRHAGADQVTLDLRPAAGRLTLAVTDDGGGFDPGELGDSQGMGVPGMRERAALAGGSFAIDTTPGRGTTVTAIIPLEGEREGADDDQRLVG
ncbi:MAG: PAS domain S-box protein [Deltaproteobacteria bacterium]|nr:PAS domain S-box protein [Candidatus Anaeroferrophillacea bacterium]